VSDVQHDGIYPFIPDRRSRDPIRDHEIAGQPVTRDEFLRWEAYDSEDVASDASEDRSYKSSASRSGSSGSNGDGEGALGADPLEILHSRVCHPSEAIVIGRFAETQMSYN
jgi:hypothetical protein